MKTGFMSKLSLQFSWVGDGIKVDTSFGAYSFRLSNFKAKNNMAHCLYAGGVALIGKAMSANAQKEETYLFKMDEGKQDAMIAFDGSLLAPSDSKEVKSGDVFVNYVVEKLNSGACGFNISSEDPNHGYNSVCAAWGWNGTALIGIAVSYYYSKELTITLLGHAATRCWDIANTTYQCVGDLLQNAPLPMAEIQKWSTAQIVQTSFQVVSICTMGMFVGRTIKEAIRMRRDALEEDEERTSLLNYRRPSV